MSFGEGVSCLAWPFGGFWCGRFVFGLTFPKTPLPTFHIPLLCFGRKKISFPLAIHGGGDRGKVIKKSRQRSTLPHSHPCSTIDAKELNFRVRDGIGCGLFAVITGKIEEAIKSHVRWSTSGRRINVSQAVLPDRFGLSLQRGGEVIKPNDGLVQVR